MCFDIGFWYSTNAIYLAFLLDKLLCIFWFFIFDTNWTWRDLILTLSESISWLNTLTLLCGVRRWFARRIPCACLRYFGCLILCFQLTCFCLGMLLLLGSFSVCFIIEWHEHLGFWLSKCKVIINALSFHCCIRLNVSFRSIRFWEIGWSHKRLVICSLHGVLFDVLLFLGFSTVMDARC